MGDENKIDNKPQRSTIEIVPGSPLDFASELWNKAKEENRVTAGEGFNQKAKEAKVNLVVPIYDEFRSGNITELLNNLISQSDENSTMVFVVNSTKKADEERLEDNAKTKRVLSYVVTGEGWKPDEWEIDEEQKNKLIAARDYLHDRIMLIDLDGQLESRNMAAVRTVGNLALAEVTDDPNKPVAWLDGDTKIVHNYTLELGINYTNPEIEAVFLKIKYEPDLSDESVAKTTLDYQFGILDFYTQQYLGLISGHDNIGFGGPLITARGGVFIENLAKLTSGEVENNGGNEDYTVTKLLVENSNWIIDSNLPVITADRKRAKEVGFDSADRASGEHAGSVVERDRRIPSFFGTIANRAAVKLTENGTGDNGLFDENYIEKIWKTAGIFGEEGDLETFKGKIKTKLTDMYQNASSGAAEAFIQYIDIGGEHGVHIDLSSSKMMHDIVYDILMEKHSRDSSGMVGYSQDMYASMMSFLQTEEEKIAYFRYINREVQTDEDGVKLNRQKVEEMGGAKAIEDLTTEDKNSLIGEYPYLEDFIYSQESVAKSPLEELEKRIPDIFSLSDEKAIADRKALSVVKGTGDFFALVASTRGEERKKRFPTFKVIDNNEDI